MVLRHCHSIADHGHAVDLTVATVKTLVRLRRDELVRMCETREIEAEGTKPQLAEALLHWRDHAAPSVQSSAGTARPPSTARPAARGSRQRSSRSGSGARTPVPVPVLLRSHVHVEQPRTPPVSGPQTPRQGVKEAEDGELELDLGSLGLDDREIPCEKLTKLEKIGSGGFKDVFIGRLKGRKVAIAEFRGQLTASACTARARRGMDADASAVDIKELKLLGEFDHPNIVRFVGAILTRVRICGSHFT
jgi:mitogen-activated protein kinase kinase kinase 13